jgi:sarcosine oxidase delta subunit
VHAYGCGRWFHVVRDTLTHAVTASYGIDEAGPRT